MNEWIPVKGCIEVVPSNSVSTSSCDIVVYWGCEQMDPVWSLLLLLRSWMGYGYYDTPNSVDNSSTCGIPMDFG